MKRKLAAGNWKMNGTSASLDEFQVLVSTLDASSIDILICPPATLIAQAAALCARTPIMIGAQDCHAANFGAHTGDISAPMLADVGAAAVILGHSERRENHNETSTLVAKKTVAAHASGLIAVICIGESLAQRETAQTLDVIADQLTASLPEDATGANTVIAYEPIWAIGTGLTPTLAQIGEVHDFIRARLGDQFGAEAAQAFRLLYGGSVKPDNAASIFTTSNVDGALVGGASLRSADFLPIIKALEA